MFVKPATPDLLVASPEAVPPMPRHLPAEGAEVPNTEDGRRRLADGDVVIAKPARAAKED